MVLTRDPDLVLRTSVSSAARRSAGPPCAARGFDSRPEGADPWQQRTAGDALGAACKVSTLLSGSCAQATSRAAQLAHASHGNVTTRAGQATRSPRAACPAWDGPSSGTCRSRRRPRTSAPAALSCAPDRTPGAGGVSHCPVGDYPRFASGPGLAKAGTGSTVSPGPTISGVLATACVSTRATVTTRARRSNPFGMSSQ
jgi:hypothetical protein